MTDKLTGEANSLTGSVKETLGAATGDRSLQADGVLDQVKGAVQKQLAPGVDGQPEIVGKAKAFAKDRPWTAAALIGVVGLAVLNTLRGKR